MLPEKMVQNAEWGPPLWRILHTLAERLGQQTHPILIQDEARLWGQLLLQTNTILPCKLCQMHYREWRARHSLEGIRGSYLRDESRRWLWALHENVNEERGVKSGIDLSGVEALYGVRTTSDLQADLEALLGVLQRATQAGLLDGTPLRVWKSTLSLLRRTIGI